MKTYFASKKRTREKEENFTDAIISLGIVRYNTKTGQMDTVVYCDQFSFSVLFSIKAFFMGVISSICTFS